MGIFDENPAITKFWKLYGETFASLYLYCARRATTKPVIAFIMKSLYENAFDEIKHNEEITLPYLYKWAYEFFSIQSQPGATGGGVKRIDDFRDVYNIKTDSGSRAIKREQILENFYRQLTYKEREVLWLTYFEEMAPADRAFVMGMSEEECTKFYYDTLKKAKEVVSAATAHQRGLKALASYFGSVASLLKKAKENEDIIVDQEIFTSLKDLFMEQFGRMNAAQTAQNMQGGVGPGPQGSQVPPQPSYQQPQPAYQPPRAQPIPTTVEPVARVDDDLEDEWLEDDEGFAVALWRRVQGVAVVILVVVIGAFGYFRFFDEDARIARLLDDSRVQFTEEFNDEQKKSFAKEALLYLTKGREYTAVNVSRKDKMIQVSFDIKDSGREAFLLYPEEQSFDYKFKWQPKAYVRLQPV